MSLSRQQEHKIDSQLVRLYNQLTGLRAQLATIVETVQSIDWIEGEQVGTDAQDRVTPIITAQERSNIDAQLEDWANTLQARWHANP